MGNPINHEKIARTAEVVSQFREKHGIGYYHGFDNLRIVHETWGKDIEELHKYMALVPQATELYRNGATSEEIRQALGVQRRDAKRIILIARTLHPSKIQIEKDRQRYMALPEKFRKLNLKKSSSFEKRIQQIILELREAGEDASPAKVSIRLHTRHNVVLKPNETKNLIEWISEHRRGQLNKRVNIENAKIAKQQVKKVRKLETDKAKDALLVHLLKSHDFEAIKRVLRKLGVKQDVAIQVAAELKLKQSDE